MNRGSLHLWLCVDRDNEAGENVIESVTPTYDRLLSRGRRCHAPSGMEELTPEIDAIEETFRIWLPEGLKHAWEGSEGDILNLLAPSSADLRAMSVAVADHRRNYGLLDNPDRKPHPLLPFARGERSGDYFALSLTRESQEDAENAPVVECLDQVVEATRRWPCWDDWRHWVELGVAADRGLAVLLEKLAGDSEARELLAERYLDGERDKVQAWCSSGLQGTGGVDDEALQEIINQLWYHVT